MIFEISFYIFLIISEICLTCLGSIWGHFRITLGSFLDTFWIRKIFFKKCSKIDWKVTAHWNLAFCDGLGLPSAHIWFFLIYIYIYIYIVIFVILLNLFEMLNLLSLPKMHNLDHILQIKRIMQTKQIQHFKQHKQIEQSQQFEFVFFRP